MSERREFPNPFPDYNGEQLLNSKEKNRLRWRCYHCHQKIGSGDETLRHTVETHPAKSMSVLVPFKCEPDRVKYKSRHYEYLNNPDQCIERCSHRESVACAKDAKGRITLADVSPVHRRTKEGAQCETGCTCSNPGNEVQAEEKIADGLAGQLVTHIEQHMKRLGEALKHEVDYSDFSVYTGTTGIALLYFHLYRALDNCQKDRYLKQAASLLKNPLRELLRRKKLTFLCGDAGPLALGAVIYDKLGKIPDKNDCLKRLLDRHKQVCTDDSLPDEFLFGKCGYLFALLFVQRHLGKDAIPVEIIDRVHKAIIGSGQALAYAENADYPLSYEWHGKKYLGAAHGHIGIFCTLMQVQDARYSTILKELVKPSIDYLMSMRFDSGNYPSSVGSHTGDKLVHWCHGAPGWIYMFIMAYKTFGDEKYLQEAKSCGEVLWERGILRKGYGICHGVSGNAYGFLALFNLTEDPKYLYRAWKFTEWCFDYGKHNCRTPDRPFSLFEGLAGLVYFLADMLDPKKAKFPAFEL